MKTSIVTLQHQVVEAQQRLDELRHTSVVEPQLLLLPQALEELSNALEELHASADELQARNDELARAYDSVERERQRYLELFELAPDAYLVTDTQGTILEANNAAATLLRRRQHFLAGKPLPIFVAPVAHSGFYQALANIQRGAGERIEEPEMHLRLHDGTELHVDISTVVVRDASGEAVGFRWLLRDISERKRIEALRAERARHATFGAAVGRALTEGGSPQAALQICAEAMVEHLGGALARIWTMNDAEQVLELQASAGLYTHLDGGHSRIPLGKLKIGRIAESRQPLLTNHVIGDPHIHDQDWARREQLVAFAGYPLVVKDTVVGVIAMFARQALSDHALEAFAMVGTEVALGIEHRRNEQRLAETQRQLELIMQTVPDVIYTLDAEARLSRWNRKLETATGLSPPELDGRPVVGFFPNAAHAVVNTFIQQAFTAGYSEIEVELLRKDGGTIPYHWTAAPIIDTQGRVIGLTGTGHDITHRKRNEQAVSLLSSRLIRLQDEERRRIGRELHDSTAQNLAGLAMNLSLLDQGRDRLTQAQRRALTESAELVGQCLAEIRTISYLLHPPLLDEVGLASAVQWYAEGFAQRSGIRVDLTITPQLGRMPEEAEIALFRIVQECLTNVHRHSGSPTVSIHIVRETRTLTLEVSDEGRGVTTAAAGGVSLGVGIAGMHERMKQLGGRLDIIHRSPGLTVRATLPLRVAAT